MYTSCIQCLGGEIMIKIGIIADDFTGASDAGSFLQLEGANCLIFNEVPKDDYLVDEMIDVIVLALKTRSVEATHAIEEVGRAYHFLRNIGTEKIYFKYASTFDSTTKGNIGPALDNLLDVMGLPYTILSPALPINGRQVKDGVLYVDGLPIDQTHMSQHPLNPMNESEVKILMEQQSKYKTFTLSIDKIKRFIDNPEEFKDYINYLVCENEKFYFAVDYFEEEHGELIAELFADLDLYSGSSALPVWIYREMGYAKENNHENSCETVYSNNSNVQGAIIAGSLSKATRSQIEYFIQQNFEEFVVRADDVLNSYEQVIEDVSDFIDNNIKNPYIVYSENEKNEDNGLIEKVLAFAGEYAVEKGIKHLVVAGGETSGAVVQAIGDKVFHVGPMVSPGVPILLPTNHEDLQIVLKSGNFGEREFFVKALKMMEKGV